MIKINKNLIINIILIIISYFAIYFLQYMINFENDLTYNNSIISLIIFGSFIYLLKKTCIEENKSKIKNAYFIGLIFSTFLVLGNSIKTNSTVEYNNIGIYFAIIFLSFIITAILVQIYKLIEKIENKEDNTEKKKLSEKKKNLIIFFIILICWVPVFLAAYPGYFCYDAMTQITNRIQGILTDWHPVLYSLTISSIIMLVTYITGSANLGIAVYTILQMIIISACFTYCIAFLRKYKVNKYIRIISILYYALFPTVVMFAMCSTKDVLFTAAVIVSIIVSIEALLDKEKFLNSKMSQCKFVLSIFLAIILRNNALYAYIPFLAIFTFVFKNKEIWKVMVGIAIIYTIYTIILYGGLKVSRTRSAEAFSVPLQQIARVYNYNKESLTEEEIEKIYEYSSEEQLKEYIPECSDAIKAKVYLKEYGYGKFLKLWFNIGIKNPGIYIDSFLANTLGFWYPDTIIDGYNKKVPDLYTKDTSYFAAMCEPPGKMDSKIPLIRDAYFSISQETVMQKIPVVSMSFSIRINVLDILNMFRI